MLKAKKIKINMYNSETGELETKEFEAIVSLSQLIQVMMLVK